MTCHLLAANSKLVENFQPKQRVLAAVLIAKKNCLQIFAASMRVIFTMTGNPPLEIDSCKPIIPRGKKNNEDVFTAALCQAIKDYNTQHAKDIAKLSAEGFAAVSAMYLRGILPRDEEYIQYGPEFGKRPVRITITKNCPEAVAGEFTKALDKISFTRFEYDLLNRVKSSATGEENPAISESPHSSSLIGSKLCSSTYMLGKMMQKLNYTLYKGEVFKKAPEGKYTLIKCCSVDQFVHAALSNHKMADLMASQVNHVASILSNKGCQMIRQMKIDYNLIEVKPFGTCFSIKEKRFIENPIGKELIRKISPRAYVRHVSYTYSDEKIPLPVQFIETVENSLEEESERLYFYRKYYHLLCHGEFPQKIKKLCLVGETNCGKHLYLLHFEVRKPVF